VTARTLKAGLLWPVSLLRWGEQAAVSSSGDRGRLAGLPFVSPGLPALRGPAGARWLKKSCRCLPRPPARPTWSAVAGRVFYRRPAPLVSVVLAPRDPLRGVVLREAWTRFPGPAVAYPLVRAYSPGQAVWPPERRDGAASLFACARKLLPVPCRSDFRIHPGVAACPLAVDPQFSLAKNEAPAYQPGLRKRLWPALTTGRCNA
jgi:hypothetical protein